MKLHVLDTNTLIYYFKNIGQVPQRLLAQSPQHIAIPTVVVYELQVGISRSQTLFGSVCPGSSASRIAKQSFVGKHYQVELGNEYHIYRALNVAKPSTSSYPTVRLNSLRRLQVATS